MLVETVAMAEAIFDTAERSGWGKGTSTSVRHNPLNDNPSAHRFEFKTV
jgi:hypothetical protein